MNRVARRKQRRRRQVVFVVVAIAVLAVGAGAAAVVLGGSDGPSDAVATTGTTAPTVGSTIVTGPAVSATAGPAPTTTTTEPDPASLPQTQDKPSTTSPKFQANVAALWNAIVRDDPSLAMPFFFPLGAYEQVKAISNPESDWRTRLVAAYEQDIHALHARLGAGANTAQFQNFTVPESSATWVPVGEEYNKGSYWRVYNSLLHYSANGQTSQFPVASMISWRGEWYVVHLSSIR